MRKIIVFILGILFAGTTVFAADDELATGLNTALQSREHAQNEFQAQVDKDETPALLKAMQQHQFRHANRMRIEAKLQEAKAKGIPVGPIADKVYEGIAKKADQEKVVVAVERVMERYEYAYRHANKVSKDQKQVQEMARVMVQARKAGLEKEDIDGIMTQLQERTRTRERTRTQTQTYALAHETVAAARDMARLGAKSATVAGVIESALRHNYQAREMVTLREEFSRQAQYSRPENVAQAFAYGIGQGTTADGLGAAAAGGGVGAAGSAGAGSSSGAGGDGGSGGGGSGGGGSGGGGSGGGGSGGGGSGGGGGGH